MNDIYIWQQALWQKLVQNHKVNGQALLLKGRTGTGKFAFAQNLAKFLLCSNPSANSKACNHCRSCGLFEQGGHPDFYQVEPEAFSKLPDKPTTAPKSEENSNTRSTKPKKKPSQQISVNQIRALSDFVYLSGHQDSYKIIIINPAESMNSAAANALLKKLEEPPPQVLFILVSHRPQLLPPTIRSRCQQITMPFPDIKTATDWLKQEGVKQPEICLAAAGFAPLLALVLNEQDYATRHDAFIEQISVSKHINPLALAYNIQQSDLPTVVSWMQKWCYDLLSFQTTGKIRYHVSRRAAIQNLSATIDVKSLVAYTRTLITTQSLSRHPLNSRLFLEKMLLTYTVLISSDWN